jgi:hypothetical protein
VVNTTVEIFLGCLLTNTREEDIIIINLGRGTDISPTKEEFLKIL